MLPNIDPATALQLKGKPGVKLAETLELAYTLIGMNTSKPPFDNAKVREALNYALNRDEIIAGRAVRRRRARRAAVAGAQGLGGRRRGVRLLQARSGQGAGAAQGGRRRDAGRGDA